MKKYDSSSRKKVNVLSVLRILSRTKRIAQEYCVGIIYINLNISKILKWTNRRTALLQYDTAVTKTM